MSAPIPHVVELRNLRLQFDEKKVLDDVSLIVEPLDRLVVMGQSGSGKSTILRLILGILPPTSGSVFFKQFEISRLPRRKLQQIRTRIGMVYQYSALLSSRNVRDNIALPLEELTKKSRDEIDRIVDEKLEMVGMSGVKDQMPSELSGGMRKAHQSGARARHGSGVDPLRRTIGRP
jgi:phospholipid/cholesterol/gamma-HCH transport system ATP-binding protein